MSQELLQLTNSGLGWAAERASMALQISEAFKAGQLPADEYRALLSDLINTDSLDSEADNLQARQMLVFGVSQLIRFAG